MSKTKEKKELSLLRQEALDAYMNREDFHYDINTDALYRQYQDRYQKLGRQAMEDTMGKAAALTGGYGSSYAQQAGQQAYHKQLDGVTEVIPELYKLAYQRYQDRSDDLYRIYQAYDQQLLQQQEEQRKQQELAQKQKELEWKQQQEQQKANAKSANCDDTYYSWLSYYQGKGDRGAAFDSSLKTQYDNGNVSTGNVLIMQRVLGLPETGMWTRKDSVKANGMTADEAWRDYTQGKLQLHSDQALGDVGVLTVNVKAMERALRLKEDGIWSKEDQKAAGGLTEAQAWEEYQKGLLQNRRS